MYTESHGANDIHRNGEFEPQIIPKGQTRLPLFNDKILALYARGMSTKATASRLKSSV
jgi:transposase-like protein